MEKITPLQEAPTQPGPPIHSGFTPSHHNGHVPPPQGAQPPATLPVYQGYMSPQPSTYGPQPHTNAPYSNRTYQTSTLPVQRANILPRKSVLEAYLLAVSPLGALGAHHFYLGRYYWGVIYFFTLGLMGCGYVIDWFRVPHLVKDANKKLMTRDPVVHGRKDLSDAYTLWFPFGFLGFHHYYLGNYAWGAAYTFSAGLFGIGWLVDAVRMPWLVQEANEKIKQDPLRSKEKNLCAAYALGLTPIGILGGHHYYLNRPLWGTLYTFTLGIGGLGWIYDWMRMPCLVSRANLEVKGHRPTNVKTADDAYILWLVFGLIGFHHMYLGRPLWGVLYFFTFGLLGIGWLVDMCRLPFLVKEVNRQNEERRMILANQIEQINRQSAVPITSSNQVFDQNQGYQNYGIANPGVYTLGSPQVQYSPPGTFSNYPAGYAPGAQGYQAQMNTPPGYSYTGPDHTVMMGGVQPPPYSPRAEEAGPLPDKYLP